MDILKDAFSNPIETLLEYEPWSQQKEHEEDIEKKVAAIPTQDQELNEMGAKKSPHSSNSGQTRSKKRSQIIKTSSNPSNPSDHSAGDRSPLRRKNTDSASNHSNTGEFMPEQKTASTGSEAPRGRDFEAKQGEREMSPISCKSQDLIDDQESIIQQKQEEIIQNQLNLTVIDEEVPLPPKPGSGTKNHSKNNSLLSNDPLKMVNSREDSAQDTSLKQWGLSNEKVGDNSSNEKIEGFSGEKVGPKNN